MFENLLKKYAKNFQVAASQQRDVFKSDILCLINYK